MNLREGEQILKIYHRHITPFLLLIIKTILVFLPFFFVLMIFQGLLTVKWLVISHIFLFFVFSFVVIHNAFIYWMDKLIITNRRIVYIYWKHLSKRDEAETRLNKIQDIQTQEKGLLAHFKFFDYGILRLDTASSCITFEFKDAPDPEGIRRFIYGVRKQTLKRIKEDDKEDNKEDYKLDDKDVILDDKEVIVDE